MFKKILIAYDGSEHALRAIKAAASLAEQYNSEVTVITVLDFATSGLGLSFDVGVIPQQVMDSVQDEAKKLLDEVVKEFGSRPVQTLTAYGHPAAEIIEESKKGYQLVVMGSRGLGELRGLIMGSVSDRVAHYVSCPVLIIH